MSIHVNADDWTATALEHYRADGGEAWPDPTLTRVWGLGDGRIFVELANESGRLAVVEVATEIQVAVRNPDDVWVDEDGCHHEFTWGLS